MAERERQKEGPVRQARKHHDVFISYAQLDKPIADAICARLEARKIRCWIAPRDVPPAKEFPAAIIEGIEESEFLLLVFSSHSNNSPHVIRELTNAVNKGRIIIPFRVEDVLPSKSMEYLISVPHWLDAITPPLEKHIEKLADSLETLLATNRRGVACPHCGVDLVGSVKFCTSCGAPVGDAPEPVQPGKEAVPPPPPPPVAAAQEMPLTPPVAEPASPEPAAPEPALQSALDIPPVPPPLMRQKNMAWIIGAAVAAVILVAALFFLIGTPAGTQSGTTAESTGPGANTMQAPVATGTIDYRSEDAPINLVTLTAEPTQALPRDLELYIEVSKDPTNAMITVQYNGGSGGKVVQANSVILTRSDGTAESATLDFSKRLSSVELQGTRGTDRLQVVVDLGTGKLIPVVDKLLSLRVRNIN